MRKKKCKFKNLLKRRMLGKLYLKENINKNNDSLWIRKRKNSINQCRKKKVKEKGAKLRELMRLRDSGKASK